MESYIIYCPHLNRDISGLLNAVPNPHIWTGHPTARGEDGCLQCHHAIVRRAMELDLPYVFVMEDDCDFVPEFSYHDWVNVVELGEAMKLGALTGGCVNVYGPKVELRWANRCLLRVAAFHSAHCIVYYRRAYEAILRTVQPFDLSIGRDQRVSCGLVWPFVAVQRPSYSGILRQQVDYVPDYKRCQRDLGIQLGLISE